MSVARFGYLVREACPCCGEPAGRARPAVAAPIPAETTPPAEHGRFLSGYAAGRTFFSYVECPSCTGRFCPVYYAPEQLDALYRRQAENMAEVPLAARRRTQERYAALALGRLEVTGDFLEIGSDIGLFSAAAARSGRFGRLWLYEPNRAVHAALESAVGAFPHAISVENFRAADVPPASIALAALVHVLDHLIEPAAMLAELRAAMKPGATLFLVTHDAGSALARALGRRWPPYTLQHPQLFTRRAIRRLLEREGFSIVEQRASVNDFPLGHLARAGLAVLGAPAALGGWQGPVLPIRLGNMATVARRG
jgi:hypothetical protein